MKESEFSGRILCVRGEEMEPPSQRFQTESLELLKIIVETAGNIFSC